MHVKMIFTVSVFFCPDSFFDDDLFSCNLGAGAVLLDFKVCGPPLGDPWGDMV